MDAAEATAHGSASNAPVAISRDQWVFLRCDNCKALFHSDPPSSFRPPHADRSIWAVSHRPCPYCGERWIYNDFDGWLDKYVADLEAA